MRPRFHRRLRRAPPDLARQLALAATSSSSSGSSRTLANAERKRLFAIRSCMIRSVTIISVQERGLIPIQPQQRSFSESNSIIAPQPVAVTQCIPPRLIAFPSSGKQVPALRPFEIMPPPTAHGQHTSPAPLRTRREATSLAVSPPRASFNLGALRERAGSWKLEDNRATGQKPGQKHTRWGRAAELGNEERCR
ncbi:hypothetical protein GY45DRAFT_1119541 [Cubamyces sp. BRFM 1775]|nr:hypothetical protein GY45DRAFT_1119541 [Cubamyces sp. BRFM 1775]